MKVLIVTNTFPPTSASHVQRMLKMSNALADFGFDVNVLTYEINKNHPQYDESFVDVVDQRINIIRAPIGFLHKKAYSTFKDESDAHYNKGAKSRNIVKSQIYGTITKLKRNILFPDTMVDWYYSVIRFEKKTRVVKKLNPDIIISCSQPNSVHLIGNKLSTMYNIPHFMDYADPWVYLGDYKEKEKTHRFKRGVRMETKVVEHAVGFSFSAPGCRDLYVDKYGINPSDTSVAMSGFELRHLDKAKEWECTTTSPKLTFTYGGALHEYVRDPKPFFAAANQFESESK